MFAATRHLITGAKKTLSTVFLLKTSTGSIVETAKSATLTLYGNTTVSSTEKFTGAKSIYLDGSGDYITTPKTSDYDYGTANFTVDAWVNLVGSTGQRVMISTYNGVDGWWFRVNSSGFLQCGYGDTTLATGTTTIGTGAWIHVAICRNGTSLTLYRNGVGDVTVTDSTSLNSTNTEMAVGALSSAVGQYFYGYISDLRITKLARYTGNFSPPTTTATLD